MAIKGKTTIELTNVETGEVRTVEDTNMVTNAFKHLLTAYPYENYTPMQKLMSPLVDNADNLTHGVDRVARMLTGGLVLFDTTLEEDVENIFPPGGAEAVGRGSTFPYTGIDTTTGSYNVAESGPIEGGGYKHVWDFGTSQGNGQIACACLTTREGSAHAGSVIYDKTACLHAHDNVARFLDKHSCFSAQRYMTNDSIYDNRPIYLLYGDADKGIIICADNLLDFQSTPLKSGNTAGIVNTRQITFKIRKLALKTYSLFDTVANHTNTEYYRAINLDTVTVDMPKELNDVLDNYMATYPKGREFGYTVSSDKGFLYITIARPLATRSYCKDYFIAPNEPIHIWKINMNDYTSEYVSVTNTTNKYLPSFCYYETDSYMNISNYYVTNDYIFVCAATDIDAVTGTALAQTNAWPVGYEFYRINLKNNADVIRITNPDGTPVVEPDATITSNYIYSRIGFHNGRVINNKLYFIHLGKPAVIDTITGKLYYRNIVDDEDIIDYLYSGWGMTYVKFARTVYVQNSSGVVLSEHLIHKSSQYDTKCVIRRFPAWLVTINNLGQTVTKTTAETMKVTYTLLVDNQLEEEEGEG